MPDYAIGSNRDTATAHKAEEIMFDAEDDQFSLDSKLAFPQNHHVAHALSVVLPANMLLHGIFARLALASTIRLLTSPMRTKPQFPFQHHFRMLRLTVSLDVGPIRSCETASLDRAMVGLVVLLAMFTLVGLAFFYSFLQKQNPS